MRATQEKDGGGMIYTTGKNARQHTLRTRFALVRAALGSVPYVRALRAGAVLGLAALTLSGCVLALDFDEERAEVCDNGIDDDLDAIVDCFDEDCLRAGACVESGGEGALPRSQSCRNGFDDDGDTLADASDPECWTERAAQAQSCASLPGADLLLSFDNDNTQLAFWGAARGESRPAGEPDARRDALLVLSAPAPDGTLDSVVMAEPIGGAWEGARLSARVFIERGSDVQLSLVPPSLLDAGGAPRLRDGDRVLGVQLDAARGIVRLAQGDRIEVRSFLATGWLQVEVVVDATEITLRVGPPGEPPTNELRLARAAEPLIAAAQLVVQGATGTTDRGAVSRAFVDDLELFVRPVDPCGVPIPGALGDNALPGPIAPGCRTGLREPREADTGETVSAASNGTLVCGVSPARDFGAPALFVIAFASADGAAVSGYTVADRVTGLVGEALDGAGVAWDAARSRWVVVSLESDGLVERLRLTTSADCTTWTPATVLDLEPPSGERLESPSLVASSDGTLAIYVTSTAATADAVEATARSLWRSASLDGSTFAPFERLAALDGVGTPVSITRLGLRDLVATFPFPRASAVSGLGVLRATDGDANALPVGRSWEAQGRVPFARRSALDVTFDGVELLSGSAFEHAGEVRVLIGARGRFSAGVSYTTNPLSSVGIARLVYDDAPRAPELRPAPSTCGNGVCDDGESCARCAVDCSCSGAQLLDGFDESRGWRSVSSDVDSPGAQLAYVDTTGGVLRVSAGGSVSQWASRTFEAIDGDFDASFDLRLDTAATDDSLVYRGLYLGLGAGAPAADLSFAPGLYARVSRDKGGYLMWPTIVTVDGTRVDGSVGLRIAGEERYRVHMARVGDELRLGLAEQNGCDGAANDVPRETTVLGAAGIVVDRFGVGGGYAGSLYEYFGQPSATLDDVLVVGATPCTRLCADECFDPATSDVACGGCGAEFVCPIDASCRDARCECNSAAERSCAGVCVDVSRSTTHCSACGNACPAGRICRAGGCVPGVPGESCSAPAPVAEGVATRFSIEGATDDEPNSGFGLNLGERVFAWTPSRNGTATISVRGVGGASVDTQLGVFVGACDEARRIAGNDDTDGLSFGSRVSIDATVGSTYLIAVNPYSATVTGSVDLLVETSAIGESCDAPTGYAAGLPVVVGGSATYAHTCGATAAGARFVRAFSAWETDVTVRVRGAYFAVPSVLTIVPDAACATPASGTCASDPTGEVGATATIPAGAPGRYTFVVSPPAGTAVEGVLELNAFITRSGESCISPITVVGAAPSVSLLSTIDRADVPLACAPGERVDAVFFWDDVPTGERTVSVTAAPGVRPAAVAVFDTDYAQDAVDVPARDCSTETPLVPCALGAGVGSLRVRFTSPSNQVLVVVSLPRGTPLSSYAIRFE